MRLALLSLLLFSHFSALADSSAFQQISRTLSYDDTYQLESILRQGISPNSTDELGKTPLMLAALNNNFKAAKLLIDNGANISAKDEGGATALHYAVRGDSKSIAALLISLGANPTQADKIGLTPQRIAHSMRLHEMQDILSIQIDTQKHHEPIKHARHNSQRTDHQKHTATHKTEHKQKGLRVGEAVIINDKQEHHPEVVIDPVKKLATPKAEISALRDMDHCLEMWDALSKRQPKLLISASINHQGECVILVDGIHTDAIFTDVHDFAKQNSLEMK